jgi:hypothetical protein
MNALSLGELKYGESSHWFGLLLCGKHRGDFKTSSVRHDVVRFLHRTEISQQYPGIF